MLGRGHVIIYKTKYMHHHSATFNKKCYLILTIERPSLYNASLLYGLARSSPLKSKFWRRPLSLVTVRDSCSDLLLNVTFAHCINVVRNMGLGFFIK